MNIRQAILKTADHIERNPHLFDFEHSHATPKNCNTPGCAIGWIAFYLNKQIKSAISECEGVINVSFDEFASRMSELRRPLHIHDIWTRTGPACAAVLRIYADKYHPATTKPLPSSVTDIFAMSPDELYKELSR